MLANSQIGVEEYLALAFPDRPEPDYVHGEVVERALPTPIHAQIQSLLSVLFAPLQKRVRLITMSELRVRIEARLFRVIDFAVYRDSRPAGRFATDPAFIAIEIVSPDDNYHNLTQRLEDYRRWGVPHVWLIDPWLKRVYEHTEAGLLQRDSLALPELDFEISSKELFATV
ncbi:MAG TPA: Uma2 family endonuclease [Bryobacteraceae bacterium]|nr:Uma2 family endonuclease [Bryobacteraceae bacterium]